MFLFHKTSKIQKIKEFILKHKIISGIILLLILTGGYFGFKGLFKSDNAVQYITAAVEKGTLIVSVSGSGQVSVSDQVDIKPKVSGNVIYVNVKKGQEIKAGTILAQLDSADAQRTVRDAEINLEKAKLSLEEMQGMVTDEGTTRGIKEKAQDDLKKAYDDGFNTVANSFLDLPGIVSGVRDILFSFNFTPNQWNIDYYSDSIKERNNEIVRYRDGAYNKYQIAAEAYTQNFKDYKSASRFSEDDVIEALILETYDTTKKIAEAIKNANNFLQFYQENARDKKEQLSDTHLASLNTYTSKTNSLIISLLSVKNTIQSDKENIIGTNFDINNQKIQVEQAENTLSDAKEKLADYYIRAPFAGIIASIDIKKGDSVSSSVVAILIAKQKIAEITLNEIDIAKIKAGQKVNLTFDAVEGLNITGEVADVDSLGAVTQGVVTYGVKIAFDTQDERVKSGMSVSTAIITDVKQNVLLVSNSALKSDNNGQYVEILINNIPQSQFVETGLSNDTMTEITSGLQQGDKVITQTIDGNASQTQSQNNSNFRIPGMGGFRD